MSLPHLIFHLGHDKTGSTAIQRALARADEKLRSAGVLFPVPAKHANHQILMPALSGYLPEDPVQMKTLARSTTAATSAAAASWRDIQFRLSHGDISKLIISSEIEFRKWTPEQAAHLNHTLDGVVDSMETVAYLRAPASYLMSVVQQDLKKRPMFRTVSPSRYRDALEPFLTTSTGSVTALEFKRSKLANGDVVSDFCHRFVPEVDAEDIVALAEHDNESISAEAISIMQGYFRGEVKAPHRWYDVRPQRFKRLVMAADQKVEGYAKPTLKPGLAEMAVARATDLTWLQDQFGIAFTDDTGGMSKSAADALYASLQGIEDVTDVDAARRSVLLDEMTQTAKRDQAPLKRLKRALHLQ